MPITCHQPLKDLIFHVLFVCPPNGVRELVEESVINIASDNPAETVVEALHLMRPCEKDSMVKLQARFFVLLNQDERMRLTISKPLGIHVQGLCPHKAERFYDALADDVLPWWIKDERLSCEGLVDRVRAIYLCS
jgi:hypothetical protein